MLWPFNSSDSTQCVNIFSKFESCVKNFSFLPVKNFNGIFAQSYFLCNNYLWKKPVILKGLQKGYL